MVSRNPDPSRLATLARARIRSGAWTGPTAGLAPGFVQANLVILSADLSAAFARYCRANARALPILEIGRAGSPVPDLASTADLRTDLPRYRIYRDGTPAEEPTDVMTLWQDDFVTAATEAGVSTHWLVVGAP